MVNRYLKLRCGRGRSGERYYLRMPVPADLRARLGAVVERCLRTSDPRVARIRRDEMLPDVLELFARARAEPSLEQVTAAARREEMARASAAWLEAIADRGQAAARQALAGMMDAEFSVAGEGELAADPSDHCVALAGRQRHVLGAAGSIHPPCHVVWNFFRDLDHNERPAAPLCAVHRHRIGVLDPVGKLLPAVHFPTKTRTLNAMINGADTVPLDGQVNAIVVDRGSSSDGAGQPVEDAVALVAEASHDLVAGNGAPVIAAKEMLPDSPVQSVGLGVGIRYGDGAGGSQLPKACPQRSTRSASS